MHMKIILNSVKCKLCEDVLVSNNCHDFRTCKCGKVSIDGGTQYLRRIGNPKSMEDLSIVVEDKNK